MTTDPDMQKRIEAGPRIVALQKWNQANGCPIRLGADLYELLAAADAVDPLRVRVDTTPEPPTEPCTSGMNHKVIDGHCAFCRRALRSVPVGDVTTPAEPPSVYLGWYSEVVSVDAPAAEPEKPRPGRYEQDTV